MVNVYLLWQIKIKKNLIIHTPVKEHKPRKHDLGLFIASVAKLQGEVCPSKC